MEKPYAVVYFVEQASYSEIPSNWLLNTDESTGAITCKWPPSIIKNLNFQFKNRLTPCDDWPIYEVKIIRYCDTLTQARKAAEDSEYSSASEKPLGKGYRLKRPSAIAAASKNTSVFDHNSSDEDDDNNKTTKPAAEMPKMNKKSIQNKAMFVPTTRFSEHQTKSTDNDDQSIDQEYSEGEDIASAGLEDTDNNFNQKDLGSSVCEKTSKTDKSLKKSNLSNLHHTTVIEDSDDDDDDGDDGRFRTLNNKLNSCLKLLGTLMVGMKDLQQRVIFNNGTNSCEINNEMALKVKNDLPLESREAVSAFEAQLLSSKNYHQEFVRIVSQVGGTNGKEYTERVLKKIFSPSFATDNTWEGKKTKYKINNLKLIKICEEVILKKFSSWDSAEFSKAGTNWFRLGNQRARQQPGQKQKQNEHQKDVDIRQQN